MSNFNDIKISTKTVIVNTNAVFGKLEDIYNTFKIINIDFPIKMKKNKIKQYIITQLSLDSGTILSIRYKNKVRGYLENDDYETVFNEEFGFYEKITPVKKNLNNSMSIVMLVEGKTLHFKVPTNGKIQMTGCKSEKQAINCIKHFFNLYIQSFPQIEQPEKTWFTFSTVMTNISFNVGFHLNREKLDYEINRNTDHYSLLDTSFGYTGASIKFELPREKRQLLTFPKIEFQNGELTKEQLLTFEEYTNYMTEGEIDKLYDPKYNTFLVFHNGGTIMTGMHENVMEEAYYAFRNFINKFRSRIEEHPEIMI